MVQFDSGEWSLTMEAVFAKIREDREKKGIEKGLEQGLEKGLEQGLEQGLTKVVLEMLRKGTSMDFIARVMHLD